MKCPSSLDRMIQHESTVGQAWSPAATKNRGMTALRALNSKPVSLEHILNQADHFFIGNQASELSPREQ